MYTREPEPNVWYTLKLGEESEEEEEDLDLDESMDSGPQMNWGAF